MPELNRKTVIDQLIDSEVKKYCEKMSMAVPEPWCYPGDIIIDTQLGGKFICGNDPKDVADVRRRPITYKVVEKSE